MRKIGFIKGIDISNNNGSINFRRVLNDEIDHKWYHLDNNGAMETGWINDGGKEYCLCSLIYIFKIFIIMSNSFINNCI